MKAAYISRVSNSTVWELAGRPTTPAQLILQQQIKLLLTCLATPPNDPFHHIVFCSALRDPIECNKKSSRGRPPPHWLSLMLDYLQLPINHFFPHHPQITNPMTLQQLINKNTSVNGLPGGEAYVRISVSFSPACQTGAAARRARLKKSSIPGPQGPGPRAYHIYKSNVKMVSAQVETCNWLIPLLRSCSYLSLCPSDTTQSGF